MSSTRYRRDRGTAVPGAVPFDLDLHSGEVVAITSTLLGSGRQLLGALRPGCAACGDARRQTWHSGGPGKIPRSTSSWSPDRWQSSLLPPGRRGPRRRHDRAAAPAALVPGGHLERDTRTSRGDDAIRRLGIKARNADATLDQLSKAATTEGCVLARWQAEPCTGCSCYSTANRSQGVATSAREDLIAAIRGNQASSATR